jgi:hypothetical protein
MMYVAQSVPGAFDCVALAARSACLVTARVATCAPNKRWRCLAAIHDTGLPLIGDEYGCPCAPGFRIVGGDRAIADGLAFGAGISIWPRRLQPMVEKRDDEMARGAAQ